jgi:hypothetical protein
LCLDTHRVRLFKRHRSTGAAESGSTNSANTFSSSGSEEGGGKSSKEDDAESRQLADSSGIGDLSRWFDARRAR